MKDKHSLVLKGMDFDRRHARPAPPPDMCQGDRLLSMRIALVSKRIEKARNDLAALKCELRARYGRTYMDQKTLVRALDKGHGFEGKDALEIFDASMGHSRATAETKELRKFLRRASYKEVTATFCDGAVHSQRTNRKVKFASRGVGVRKGIRIYKGPWFADTVAKAAARANRKMNLWPRDYEGFSVEVVEVVNTPHTMMRDEMKARGYSDAIISRIRGAAATGASK